MTRSKGGRTFSKTSLLRFLCKKACIGLFLPCAPFDLWIRAILPVFHLTFFSCHSFHDKKLPATRSIHLDMTSDATDLPTLSGLEYWNVRHSAEWRIRKYPEYPIDRFEIQSWFGYPFTDVQISMSSTVTLYDKLGNAVPHLLEDQYRIGHMDVAQSRRIQTDHPLSHETRMKLDIWSIGEPSEEAGRVGDFESLQGTGSHNGSGLTEVMPFR